MSMKLNDFTEDDTDEPAETGPELNLYTAGSGNGKWAYVGEGANTDKTASYTHLTLPTICSG